MPAEKNYTEKLKEVIAASSFKVEAGSFIYARAEEVRSPEKHLMVIRENAEITIVTKEENISLIGTHEANKEKWKLINIRCGKPFYCVGFIAYITDALACEGIDIVLTSSFSNDLLLVMEKDLEKTVVILQEKGFAQAEAIQNRI